MKEVHANQQLQIKIIESQFYHNIKLLIPQLTFEMSTLFNSLNEDSTIYKTVSLGGSDKDYDFIMRSLNNKGFANIPKVLHMFRIIPADQTDVKYLYNNNLYLHGVKADKVMNILKQGYPKFDKKLSYSEKCSCYSSGLLDLELEKGTSYCKVGDEVKELSFVFVASDVHIKSSIVPSEVPSEDLDSRRCRFHPNFCSNFIFDMVPAYLIIFSL